MKNLQVPISKSWFNFHFIFLFVSASLTISSVCFGSEVSCESALFDGRTRRFSAAEDVILSNSFTDRRTLSEYFYYFNFRRGRSLEVAMRQAPKDSIWFDMGSGRNIALVKGLEQNPNIATGVGVTYKSVDFSLNDARVPGRLKIIKGHLLEDLADKGSFSPWTNKVHLITDVFGPATYSDRFAKVIKTYLDLLHPNGDIFISLQVGKDDGHAFLDSRNSFIAFNPIRTETGLDQLGLVQWLKSIRGIEVEYSIQEEFHDTHYEKTMGIRIHKNNSLVVVPQNLRMLLYDKSIPPKRMFEIVE